jgi:hypothetical protein
MSDAKTHAETLLGAVLPFAEKMLADYGEFHPFGGAMRPDGEIVSIAGYDGRDCPPSKDTIELLASAFREAALAKSYIATAIVYDVRVTPPGESEPKDAVAAELEHSDGYAVTVFVPYRFTGTSLDLEPPFATGDRRGIFGGLQ